MEELTRTDDPVFLSALLSALAHADIEAVVFDSHTSSVFPGVLDTVGQRVMVAADVLPKAEHILARLEERE